MPKINTTGKLRGLLLETLDKVVAGTFDPGQANAIVKIATQINMSLLTEAQIARMDVLANRPTHALGELPIKAA